MIFIKYSFAPNLNQMLFILQQQNLLLSNVNIMNYTRLALRSIMCIFPSIPRKHIPLFQGETSRFHQLLYPVQSLGSLGDAESYTCNTDENPCLMTTHELKREVDCSPHHIFKKCWNRDTIIIKTIPNYKGTNGNIQQPFVHSIIKFQWIDIVEVHILICGKNFIVHCSS